MERSYIAIDLKSFYASVECVERGLDPMTTNLVVADASRTSKAICLAVSPSLKAYGISGRARLFEVIQKIKQINQRLQEKQRVEYITAIPRMSLYMEYSTRIYKIYLKHVAPEDIHVYSIDEVFIDATNYLKTPKRTTYEFAKKIILDILDTTGITATAGIGSNLYLCKIAMDIMAKRTKPDRDGVCVANLDEMSYRKELWDHKPLTDFWRVGQGYAKKLISHGMETMGDIAKCSLGREKDVHNEELLYNLFGVNAELLIDHAWGYEPCTMGDIKAYKPKSNSIGTGQVLQQPYDKEKAKIIVREMADFIALDLVDKGLVTNQVVLTVGYDVENLSNPTIRGKYKGQVTIDHYGRQVPKHAHGTINLSRKTSSAKLITAGVLELFEKIVHPKLLVRRINISVNNVVDEGSTEAIEVFEQLSLFESYEEKQEEEKALEVILDKERKVQEAVLEIKKRYGKNAVLKGTNWEEGATTRERNNQIGGHKA